MEIPAICAEAFTVKFNFELFKVMHPPPIARRAAFWTGTVKFTYRIQLDTSTDAYPLKLDIAKVYEVILVIDVFMLTFSNVFISSKIADAVYG